MIEGVSMATPGLHQYIDERGGFFALRAMVKATPFTFFPKMYERGGSSIQPNVREKGLPFAF